VDEPHHWGRGGDTAAQRDLRYLGAQDLPEPVRAGIRLTPPCLRYDRTCILARSCSQDDLNALASSLHQRTLERETREIAHLDQVLTLAAHDGCQTAFLTAHFGEQLSHPCVHCCSWCENGGKPAKLYPPAPVHLDEASLRRAAALRRRSRSWPLREPSPAS
jgi:hypothetical protein